MKSVGKVISLFITDKISNKTKTYPNIILDMKGIQQDKHYDKNNQRSILISSTESYSLSQAHNIDISFGKLGENILVDFNPYLLPASTKIKINNCILEITQGCTLCKHLTSIDNRLPKLLKNDRGIFTKVVQGGEIYVGDDIYIIS